MATTTRQTRGGSVTVWALARAQHGLVTRRQLVALGLTDAGIKHRIARGRLHPVARGVHAVGRAELTPNGRRMVAVLACGGDVDRDGGVELRPGRRVPAVVLSHASAAGLFAIGPEPSDRSEITTIVSTGRRVPGVSLHRRRSLRCDSAGYYEGIPVTSPVQTLIDLATRYGQGQMERAINEADKLGLVRTDDLRQALDDHVGEPGVGR